MHLIPPPLTVVLVLGSASKSLPDDAATIERGPQQVEMLTDLLTPSTDHIPAVTQKP